MRIFIIIGLGVFVVLLSGYGGVLSLERAFGETASQVKFTVMTEVSDVNEGEHVECVLNETKGGAESDAPRVADEYGKIRLGGLSFFTSLESGLEEANLNERPVFLYLHSRSCGWCKRFEEEVLTDSRVISTVETSFVPVVIEVNEQKDMAVKFKVYGTPTMVFLDPGGSEIERIRGYVDAETFATRLAELKNISISGG